MVSNAGKSEIWDALFLRPFASDVQKVCKITENQNAEIGILL
jgi:hypothetical protein